jgi:hypothetical protein
LTIIDTVAIMAIMWYADRDVPGALPPLTIIGLEGDLIDATIAMRSSLSAECDMTIGMDNRVWCRVPTPTRLVVILVVVSTPATR